MRSPRFVLAAAAVLLASHAVVALPAGAGPVLAYRFKGIELNNPWGLALDRDESVDEVVFVADTANNRIVKYRNGRAVLVFGDGLNRPQAVAVHDGQVFVADTDNSRIQVFDATTGEFLRGWGTQGSEPGQLDHPGGIAVGDSVAVADTFNHRVAVFGLDGTFIETFGSHGTTDGTFVNPVGIAAFPGGGWLVTDGDESVARVQGFTADGEFAYTFGTYGTEPGEMVFPDEIAIDGDRNIYVAEAGNTRIQTFDEVGGFISELNSSSYGSPLQAPHGVAVSAVGKLFVASSEESLVYAFEERAPEIRLAYNGITCCDVKFRIAYNQVDQICEGSLKSVFTIHRPDRYVIRTGRRVNFSDVGRRATAGLEEGEFNTLMRASLNGRRVIGRSTLDAGCSDDATPSETIRYRV